MSKNPVNVTRTLKRGKDSTKSTKPIPRPPKNPKK